MVKVMPWWAGVASKKNEKVVENPRTFGLALIHAAPVWRALVASLSCNTPGDDGSDAAETGWIGVALSKVLSGKSKW